MSFLEKVLWTDQSFTRYSLRRVPLQESQRSIFSVFAKNFLVSFSDLQHGSISSKNRANYQICFRINKFRFIAFVCFS